MICMRMRFDFFVGRMSLFRKPRQRKRRHRSREPEEGESQEVQGGNRLQRERPEGATECALAHSFSLVLWTRQLWQPPKLKLRALANRLQSTLNIHEAVSLLSSHISFSVFSFSLCAHPFSSPTSDHTDTHLSHISPSQRYFYLCPITVRRLPFLSFPCLLFSLSSLLSLIPYF